MALLTGLASAAVTLIYDSSLDVTCWARCNDEPFVDVGSGTLLRAAQVVLLALLAAAGASTVLGSMTSLRSRGSSRGWPRDLIGLSGLVLGVTLLAVVVPTVMRYMNVRPLGTPVGGREPVARTLPAGVRHPGGRAVHPCRRDRVACARRMAITARVRRIATAFETAPAPGSLQLALASALGDPTLRVRYWMEHEARFVDAGGRAVSDVGTPDDRFGGHDPTRRSAGGGGLDRFA